ncbi:hypothetical protein BV20DRAFT_964203 [Pilatotrama ljubarskyi]|nr:hypothetical protein BV20DRAFT_964203 [Pilatotrama ljubarskyi]
MGGNAFKAIISDAAFPRMPPAVYNALKTTLLPLVRSLYTHVTVPPEAPGKADYGDLDFVVSGPREGLTHEDVRSTLRAAHSVPMPGNRTSNFAIAMDAFQEVARACRDYAARPQDPSPFASGDANLFFQVDVNVCADRVQQEQTVFYSSYGGLGLMIGLLVQTAGLSFGVYGLKLADPIGSPLRTFYLSSSTSDVLAFVGLSTDKWKRGFATQDELFSWVASSPFAVPLAARLKSHDSRPSAKQRVEERPMRQNFVKFLQEHDFTPQGGGDAGSEATSSIFAKLEGRAEKLEAALQYFGKYEEYTAILRAARAQDRSKAVLNGKNVMEWTGVSGAPVRFILDEAKERLAARLAPAGAEEWGADREVPAWQRALLDMSDEEVRTLLVSVKEELDVAGKLEFDWRAAKAAKLERKKQKEAEAAGAAVGEDQAVTVRA